MDWKDIAPIVGAIAPVAGGIIGGAFGGPLGATAGSALGKALGSALGVQNPTPQATSDAFINAPEETKRTAINAALEQCRAQIQGFTEQERIVADAMVRNAADVNATMRVEATAPESLFYRGWRPAFGWVFVAVWGVFGVALIYVTLRAAWLSDNPLKTLQDAWPLFASYFGPGAAVLGVLIPSRSAEKVAALQTGQPMLNVPQQPTPVPTKVPLPVPRPPLKILPDRTQTGGG